MKVVSALLLGALAGGGHAQESTTLKLTQSVSLPGVKGRFDHFAVDVKGRRLFVAALGNNTLEVLDVGAAKHVKRGCLRARARAPASSRPSWTGSISPFRIATVATARFAFTSPSEAL